MKFRIHILFLSLSFALFASACAGLPPASWPGLTTDGETIFLAFGPHVRAIDAANGVEVWKFPQEADNKLSFFASPALSDGQLIVGGYNNVLYSLNPVTGQPNAWTFDDSRNRYIGNPLATDQVILAPSADRNLYALDLDGVQIWKFLTQEAQWGQPATDGETVYLTSLDHHLYAIDLQTGQELWKADLGGAVAGTPLFVDGVVYVGSFANRLTALVAQTGKVRWTFPTSDWVWTGPAIDGETLYFGDIGGTLYAVDVQSGEERWKFPAEGGIFSSPLVADGKIYFTTDAGSVYALDANGEKLWSQKIVGKMYTSPILVKNLVVVALMESDKILIAYDENGIERWSYPPVKPAE